MSQNEDEFNDDIYSISDVVRNAHSLIIVVGQSPNKKDTKTVEELLFEWGDRLWAFPEALLAPLRQDILVYTRGDENSSPEIIPNGTH
jgi:hypothetical protein